MSSTPALLISWDVIHILSCGTVEAMALTISEMRDLVDKWEEDGMGGIPGYLTPPASCNYGLVES